MARQPAWTPAENAALVSLYFTMLDCAVAGYPYNKAAMIRNAQDPDNYSEDLAGGGWHGWLRARSKQSIEFKLMNASACHAALDPHADTMDVFGYRAMPNYQAALKDAMAAELERRSLDDWAAPLRFNHAS